jgi:uncharacterized membrane protein
MLQWLIDIYLPFILFAAIIISFCYICLSFHLYRIGIDERSALKRKSALVSLVISLIVFAASNYYINRIDTSALHYFFPFAG